VWVPDDAKPGKAMIRFELPKSFPYEAAQTVLSVELLRANDAESTTSSAQPNPSDSLNHPRMQWLCRSAAGSNTERPKRRLSHDFASGISNRPIGQAQRILSSYRVSSINRKVENDPGVSTIEGRPKKIAR